MYLFLLNLTLTLRKPFAVQKVIVVQSDSNCFKAAPNKIMKSFNTSSNKFLRNIFSTNIFIIFSHIVFCHVTYVISKAFPQKPWRALEVFLN